MANCLPHRCHSRLVTGVLLAMTKCCPTSGWFALGLRAAALKGRCCRCQVPSAAAAAAAAAPAIGGAANGSASATTCCSKSFSMTVARRNAASIKCAGQGGVRAAR